MKVTDAHRLVLGSTPALVEPARVLLQHACLAAPEKADLRAKTVSVRSFCLTLFHYWQYVSQLVLVCPSAMHVSFAQWLTTFSQNTKINCRVAAVELALEFLLVRVCVSVCMCVCLCVSCYGVG